MKTTIIITPDPAGQNVKKFLIVKKINFYETQTLGIVSENVDECVGGDVLIFATTHKSSQGIPCLTIHFPGNFGNADLGGKEKELCIAPASLLKNIYLAMKKHYTGEVTMEATHHGPYLRKAAVFVEIGCTEKNWKDPALGKIIAEAIEEGRNTPKQYKTIIVLGGGHYSPEVNKILTDTEYAVGHFCSKYNLKFLDETMLLQMHQKNVEKIDSFALDWKGMGAEKERIISLLDKLKLPYKKTKEITGSRLEE